MLPPVHFWGIFAYYSLNQLVNINISETISALMFSHLLDRIPRLFLRLCEFWPCGCSSIRVSSFLFVSLCLCLCVNTTVCVCVCVHVGMTGVTTPAVCPLAE